MKIEIGESLLLSWLRHVKECQLVQTNWKASAKWELLNRETLERLMQSSSDVFQSKYGYNIYKSTSGLDQLLGQAEIDVLGIHFGEDGTHIYVVDVAFHEQGLNYGSRVETVARVIKKFIRSAMCIYGYFGFTTGEIVFASPKIHPSVMGDLTACIGDISAVLQESGLNYGIRVISNDGFNDKVLQPVLSVLGDVADTSELFLRSLQMYNLFAGKSAKALARSTTKITKKLEAIEYKGLEGLEEMKIGVIVRTVLRKMLEEGKATRQEVEQMQTKEYSKEVFDIQYPLLLKAGDTDKKSPVRYYASPIRIYGEDYFLCSEWFEVPANNDRPHLLKWLALHA